MKNTRARAPRDRTVRLAPLSGRSGLKGSPAGAPMGDQAALLAFAKTRSAGVVMKRFSTTDSQELCITGVNVSHLPLSMEQMQQLGFTCATCTLHAASRVP